MSDRHVLPPYSLRMPAELRDNLESSASQGKRSLNAEIVARLEDSFLPKASETKTMGALIDQLIAMGEKNDVSVEVVIRGRGADEEESEENADD